MNIPKELKYAKSHEWVRLDDDVATIGISDYAQSELGDIVFVELPEPGDATIKDDACGTIEAVKTVSDINSPVTGKIMEVNIVLEDEPTLVNTDCYKAGWIIKVKVEDPSELDELMDAEAYEEFVG
ncbi:MAG: glycine cleavage system protein GcvH [Candidatus Marinimicrobia bacterium]|nr:glycine cleavage system protein GcvH [Candidatus Neomarinimicrobiota bacterium]